VLTNEQKAHDLAIAVLGSGEPKHRDSLFLALEEDGQISSDDGYVIRYKKSYDFLFDSFLSEFEE